MQPWSDNQESATGTEDTCFLSLYG